MADKIDLKQVVSLIGSKSEEDHRKAFDLCFELAKKNTYESYRLLAVMYRDGTGTDKNIPKAIEWMRKYIKENEDRARSELVSVLMKSQSEEDKRDAFEICSALVEGENKLSQFRLAVMYRDGIGTDKNIPKAIEWMRKCRDYGTAEDELYKLLTNSPSEDDRREAFDLYSRRVESENNKQAQFKLATLYRDGIGTDKNIPKAIELMRKCRDHDLVEDELIKLLMKSPSAKDRREVFNLCSKQSKEENNKLSQFRLAVMYRDGIGTGKNIPKAIELMHKSNIENGEDPSTYVSAEDGYSKYAMFIKDRLQKDNQMKSLGYNTGNLAFRSAIQKLFKPDLLPHDFEDYGIKLDKYEAVILTELIWIRENANFTNLYEIVKKSGAKFVPMSVGLQSPDNNPEFKLHESVVNMLKLIQERSVIGVRGEYTANILRKYGITNIQVIGCPSMYYFGDRNLKIENHLSENIIATSNFRTFERNKSVNKKEIEILNYFKDHNMKFVEQTKERISDAASLESECSNSLFEYLEQRHFYFNNIDWLNDIRNCNFSMGLRFHGNVMALRAGMRALFITSDSRTREMVNFFNLPAVDVNQFDSERPPSYYLDLANYERFNEEYPKRFDAFVEFLSKNNMAIQK